VLWGYNKTVQAYPYDVAKAKQLLTEAGFASGFTTQMMVYPNPRGYNPIGGAKLGEAVQGYLAKVGVNVKITQYEWGAYLDTYRHTPWEGFAISGWSGDNGDPDNFFVPLLGCEAVKGGGNAARWCNKQFEDLVVKAAQTPKQADRAKLYEQAQVIFKEEAPWITLAHSIRFDPVRKEVKGYKMDATAHHYFNRVDLAPLP